MIKYEGYTIAKFDNYVKLTTNYYLEFDSLNDENYMIGTPSCWDDYLNAKLNLYDYDCYFICTCTIPYDKCNRLTDYKKIWGLTSTKEGVYDNSYINTRGKVYYGIIKSQGTDCFKKNISSVVILQPKIQLLDFSKVFDVFACERFDFQSTDGEETFAKLQCVLCDSIILRYNIHEFKVELYVYGRNLAPLFSDMNINDLRQCDVNIVGKKFGNRNIC